jgi:hypothetical protein
MAGLESKEIHHTHTHDQPLKIKLESTTTGYRWEIHIAGKDLAEVLPKIREANNKLKGEYGGRKQ